MSRYEQYIPKFETESLPIIVGNEYDFTLSSNEDFIDSLTQTLSVFYNRITFAEDLTNHFIKIDLIYQKKLKEQFDNFKSLWFSLSSDEKKKANGLFMSVETGKIPTIRDFISIMKSFSFVASDICGIADQALKTTVYTEVPDLFDLFSRSDISQYSDIGIDISEGSISFENPFEIYPDDTLLRELGYTSLDSIQEINKTYEFSVFGPIQKLLRTKNYLLSQYGLLKDEMTNSQKDEESIRLRFRASLFISNTVCNVFSKLLMLNRMFMYKNKKLLDEAIKSVVSVMQDRR